MITEMSYNLLASLDRFMYDPDFRLIASILLSELPQVYRLQGHPAYATDRVRGVQLPSVVCPQ